MKAKKRAVLVDTFKYKGSLLQKNGEWYGGNWVGKAWRNKELIIKDKNLYVVKDEGNLKVNIGDYIIKDFNEKIHPCKASIFKKTYKKAKNDPSIKSSMDTKNKSFIKKEIIVEVILFNGWNWRDCYQFMSDKTLMFTQNFEQYTSIGVKTLEGQVAAKIGDYIIKGVEGEFYPIKPDVFNKTYEIIMEN